MIPVYEGDHSITITQEVYDLRSTPHAVIYLELTTESGIMTIAPKHPLEYYLLESGKRVITTFDFSLAPDPDWQKVCIRNSKVMDSIVCISVQGHLCPLSDKVTIVFRQTDFPLMSI